MFIRGIIFDLDGVLCSTDEYHYLAWKHLAESIGILNFTREDNARQRGISRMESLEVVLEKSPRQYTQEEKVQLADRKNAEYVKLLEQMSEKDLSDGVKKTLLRLKASELKLAVGSSSKNTPVILQKLGLDTFFDAIADGNMIKHSKPAPEVFLLAAEKLGLKSEDCLVVEDAYAGIEAGKRGGFLTAGIGTAADCPLADYALRRFEDLPGIVFGTDGQREGKQDAENHSGET